MKNLPKFAVTKTSLFMVNDQAFVQVLIILYFELRITHICGLEYAITYNYKSLFKILILCIQNNAWCITTQFINS